MSIKTADGRTADIVGQTYVKKYACAAGKIIVTDVIMSDGTTYAGPLFEAAEWKKIEKAQKLKAQWLKADSKATGYYKESRYMIVNKTASDAKISKVIDMMTKWEDKRTQAQTALAQIGIDQF